MKYLVLILMLGCTAEQRELMEQTSQLDTAKKFCNARGGIREVSAPNKWDSVTVTCANNEFRIVH